MGVGLGVSWWMVVVWCGGSAVNKKGEGREICGREIERFGREFCMIKCAKMVIPCILFIVQFCTFQV